MARALDRCINIADVRARARGRLPSPIWDYLDGGADDERSLTRNRAAFAEYEFVPDVLTDISEPRTATKLFGRQLAWPLMLSPTGLTRMFHPAAEPAVARAAASAGVAYGLSTLGTTRLEALAAASDAPKIFQIYIFKDRGLTAEFVDRCKAAGYDGLALTVDTPVPGNRERDRRSGFSLPPRLTMRSLASFARHPGWSLPALTGSKFDFANVSHRTDLLRAGPLSLFDYINRQFDPTLTWADVEWLAARWGGPLAVKGVMTADDARQAELCGATSVIVSNHGGRQLDGAAAPIDQIESIAEAAGGRLEIVCDGGIRRGSDIVKALARGATACSIGRPYLYGLIAGGEAGVDRALEILRGEFDRTLKLLGVADIERLDRRHVRRIGAKVAGHRPACAP